MAEETMSAFSPPRSNLEGGAVAAGTQTPAGRGARFVAILLDGLLYLPVVVVWGLASAMSANAGQGSGGPGVGAGIGMAVAGLVFLAVLGYQIYLLSTRGQTLGKRWMKVKIVKQDGSPPGFVHAVLLRLIVNGLLGVVPAYGLVDILFIFRDDRRCIHDLIASTKVVVAE